MHVRCPGTMSILSIIAPLAQTNGKGNPGDWNCPNCRDLQFARNTVCRSCGTSKPSHLVASSSTALALVPATKEMQPGDWTCPVCQFHCFKTLPFCRKCNTPKPDSPEQAAAYAAAALQPVNVNAIGALGYIAPGTIKPVSSWAAQWSGGPPQGMFVGEKDLPAWLTGEDEEDASGSDAGQDRKRQRADESAPNAKARARPKREPEKKAPKVKRNDGLTKEERKKKKEEFEAKKREEMRERRKNRVISLD